MTTEKVFNWLGGMAIGLGWAIALSALTTQLALAQDTPTPSSPAQSLNFLQAVILGAVQGLTEFIPISSTAHLKAVPVFLGWGDPGVTFTAVIQLGSIAAVLWYFWADIVHLSFGAWTALQKKNYQATDLRIAVGIAVGTLPIVFFGLLLKALVPDLDNSPIRSMTAIAIASIIMGLLLGFAEKLGSRLRGFDKLGTKDGIIMGVAQTLALIPGVSRSGSTITAGLFFGLERATAARFSFLLGIPAITLAGLVQLKTDVIDAGVSGANLMPLIVGTISSAIFSYLAIAWLIRYLQRQSTWVFVWYRVIFGVFILGGVGLGWFI
ncbi:undecaprenyl-diphosphate phosphatase [Spirulina sp. CS-785/01]|uniref:undecaprenyl-diphosphate phosphatase n=1 Tax=Spirulina sp. CS-785/01 TaxID=3021716 RepID=UPI00232BC39F|nr:undecaprenyl-diphosphate phosphatase [Spirulina sp. CS-785/01]MDB9312898.1 undecaprenyl-diphosphate phosphatase [Spirulina sp. CS-785/01]